MAQIIIQDLLASARSRRQPTDGVTLVAVYGNEKPDQFVQLLSKIEESCKAEESLAGWIRLYKRAQVHATIVGLEGKRNGNSVVQENYSKRVGGDGPWPPINFKALLGYFSSSVSDVQMMVGGLGKESVNPFDHQKPFQRSFDIRSDGLLVAMGWPRTNGRFTSHLIALRKDLEKFNVVHKYHIQPQAQDNDLFFVIGEVDADRWRSASTKERDHAQKAIDALATECRQILLENRYTFSLRPKDLYVVKYKLTSLESVCSASRVTEIDHNTLLNLYPA